MPWWLEMVAHQWALSYRLLMVLILNKKKSFGTTYGNSWILPDKFNCHWLASNSGRWLKQHIKEIQLSQSSLQRSVNHSSWQCLFICSLIKQMIIFTNWQKPIPQATKGMPMRVLALEQFETEIHSLYKWLFRLNWWPENRWGWTWEYYDMNLACFLCHVLLIR